MKNRCPQCDYELRTETSFEKMMRKTLMKAEAQDNGGMILSGFEAWELEGLNVARYFDRFLIRKVDQDLTYDFEYASNYVYMVFEVGYREDFEGSDFFKVEGTKDSYGGSDWDVGNFRQVEKQEKVVWLWSE